MKVKKMHGEYKLNTLTLLEVVSVLKDKWFECRSKNGQLVMQCCGLNVCVLSKFIC